MTEIVEGEIIDEHGTDLEVRQEAAPTLFHTSDPVKVIEGATRIATPLAGLVKKQGLAVNIQGREHVKVEGWTLLGSMLGVFPVTVWTREIVKDGKGWGWEARVEAHTRDGAVIGAAEAQCTRDENQWSFAPKGRNGQTQTPRDDYALRSMAQTRATSKALRQPLGFVMHLAGFEATPAEEMPADGGGADPHGFSESRADNVPPHQVTVNFGKHSGETIGQILETDRGYVEWLAQKANHADVREAAKVVLTAESQELANDLDDIPF